MATPEEKKSLIAKCVELLRNDPSATKLDLRDYGKLEWDDTSRIADSLANNTRVTGLLVSLSEQHLSLDGMVSAIPLLHFLRSSPSLDSIVVISGQKGRPVTDDSHSTAYILEAISHNKLVNKLQLHNIVYEKPSIIEKTLAKTLTLEELIVTDSHVPNSEVYLAFRRGLEQNNSIKTLEWVSQEPYRDYDLGEVFFGLSNHAKLTTLKLDVMLNRASSQALRSCLQANETLDYFSLRLKHPTLTEELDCSTLNMILLGLACNRGVTHFHIHHSPLSLITSATAWVELLQKNASIKILELMYCSIERDDMSAIARGLEGNTSVETLTFKDPVGPILHGPAWQAMLQRNRCLKEIILVSSFTRCEISSGEFACLAGGLVQNTSLKSLDLSNLFIGNAGIVALVEALGSTDTLESLVLENNEIKGEEGATAVRNLWRKKTLKHLSLACNFIERDGTPEDTGFPADLSSNCVFETLNLHMVGLQSQGCRTVCESLQGNSFLRELDLSKNPISLDVDCAIALTDLLGSTTLRVLNLFDTRTTNEGIELLARGLQGNSSLRELDLQHCDILNEGLMKLGEALVQNSTLEILLLCDDFGEDAVSQFFELLPQMKGLKELRLNHCDVMNNEELCVAVIDGLRKNTSLQRLKCEGGTRIQDNTWHDQAPSHIKPLIAFYLNLNRNGRRMLEPPLVSRIPLGLWPRILANMSSPKDISLLYYFLRKRPSLVVE
jgi:Ran GTPase-activating protein (RanGAP) involved in mRNA processing and transport